MPQEITKFEKILNKFYDRIEKDEDFFSYYNIDVSEAIQIAQNRATNYLCEALDELSCLSNLDVDFSDYDEDVQQIGFKLLPTEIKLVVEIMFLIYMKRDESLLHAMEINFTPSDLSVFSPGNERTSYRNFIAKLEQLFERFKETFTKKMDVNQTLQEAVLLFLDYETTLAYNKAPLSDSVYEKLNEKLSKEWEEIKTRYEIS